MSAACKFACRIGERQSNIFHNTTGGIKIKTKNGGDIKNSFYQPRYSSMPFKQTLFQADLIWSDGTFKQ